MYIHRLLGMLWIHLDDGVAHNKPGTNCMHIGLSVLFFKALGMLGGDQETSCMYGGHWEYWWCLHNLVSACSGSCLPTFFYVHVRPPKVRSAAQQLQDTGLPDAACVLHAGVPDNGPRPVKFLRNLGVMPLGIIWLSNLFFVCHTVAGTAGTI
eukprot:jgi/Botrbrau1/23495/Bobra.106_1s0046.1